MTTQSETAGHADALTALIESIQGRVRIISRCGNRRGKCQSCDRQLHLVADDLAALAARMEPVEVGEMLCPWCGERLLNLKPAGGCLVGEINGYGFHAQCADEVEAAKMARMDGTQMNPWLTKGAPRHERAD